MPQLTWAGLWTAFVPETQQISTECVCVQQISCTKSEGIFRKASKSTSLRLHLSHCHFQVTPAKPERDAKAVQRKAC